MSQRRTAAARDAATLARRQRAYVALRTRYTASVPEAAHALGISVPTARRYERSAREAGELPARPHPGPRTPPAPGPWVAAAACATGDHDPQWWTPQAPAGSTERQQAEERARQVCRTCPVVRACLRHALAVGEIAGIWGGRDPVERALSGGEEAARAA